LSGAAGIPVFSLWDIIFPGGARTHTHTHLKWSRPDLFGPLSAAVRWSHRGCVYGGQFRPELEAHCRAGRPNGVAAAFIAAVERN